MRKEKKAKNLRTAFSEETSPTIKELPALNFIEAVKLLAQKNFSFKGRSRRSEFIWMMITYIPINLLCIYVFYPISYPVFFIISVLVALFVLAVMVRRLHDINISGWWAIIPFMIIVLYFIILFFYCDLLFIILSYFYYFYNFIVVLMAIILICLLGLCLFKDGTNGDNKYGPSPKYIVQSSQDSSNHQEHWIIKIVITWNSIITL